MLGTLHHCRHFFTLVHYPVFYHSPLSVTITARLSTAQCFQHHVFPRSIFYYPSPHEALHVGDEGEERVDGFGADLHGEGEGARFGEDG